MGCGVVEWLVVWQCQQKNHLLAHRYWVLTLNNNVLCLFVNLRQQLTLTTRQTTTTMMRRTTNLRQATKQVWTTKKHFLFQAKQLTLRISSINKIYNHLVNRAVWPDWAFLLTNFTSKYPKKLCDLVATLKNSTFYVKTHLATSCVTFCKDWSHLHSNIWSHWSQLKNQSHWEATT